MKQENWHDILKALGLIAQLGIVMLANIAAGFYGGYLLDNFTGREIIFKIIGLLMGVFSGFYANYRLIKDVFKEK